MKKFAIALVMLMVSMSAFSQFVSAPKGQTYKKNVGQTVSSSKSTLSVQNKWKTYEEALAAYRSGKFSYYVPSDLRSYGKNSVDGVTKVLIPLEQDAIEQSPVVGGTYFIISETGTGHRWYKNSNGCIADKPYAIDACGNAILFFEYVTREREVIAAEAPLNNYSERPIYNQPHKTPDAYKYPCNGYKNIQDPYQPIVQKQGWSTGKKIVVTVIAAAATYAIIAYATRSKGGSESSEQVVVTGGASFAPQTLPSNLSSAPRPPSVGLAFGIRF